jgi:hypothetical protein
MAPNLWRSDGLQRTKLSSSNRESSAGRFFSKPSPQPDRLLSKDTWLASIGNSPYPLPSFYSAMFGGAALALSTAVLEEMRMRRVGEYVINECM